MTPHIIFSVAHGIQLNNHVMPFDKVTRYHLLSNIKTSCTMLVAANKVPVGKVIAKPPFKNKNKNK